MTQTYDLLNQHWKSTCKVVFGQEIGDLSEYSSWLRELTEKISYHKSALSGKEVISAPTSYGESARWLAFDEVDFNKTSEPLNINQLKDLDSLSQALSEKFYYTGSIVFGKSANIDRSSNINDSIGIYEVGRLGDSKYVAYSTMCRYIENCFGANFIGESSYCIKANDSFRNHRSLEVWRCIESSDTYFSHGLINCANCLFTFNLWNKKYAIGNLELEKSKYQSIKSAILSEMVEELKKNKRLPSLLDIVEKSKWEKPKLDVAAERIDANEVKHKEKIEDAFSKTTSIIFGKSLEGGVDEYAGWLKKHTRPVLIANSAVSGKEIYVPNCAKYPEFPKNRLMSLNEAEVYGQLVKMSPEEVETLTLGNVHEKIGKLAFFDIEFIDGKNANIIDCAIVFDSGNCYRSTATVYAKYCAYSFWPRNSQYLFGADSPFDSNFSINIYSCTNQTRCLEIDCCGYCSDTYFSHNCENVNDSMFCFNTKNKRYCIGNAPLPQNDYRRIKSSLMEQIHNELDSTKDLKYDIYNILSKR